MFTWGRRMSKKLELLRRNDLSKSFDVTPFTSTPNTTPKTTSIASDTLRNFKHKIVRSATHVSNYQQDDDTRSLHHERQKTLKTFFHRIGSTGMLNHKSNNSLKQQHELANKQLYRSSSTSQLNTLTSYIKCDGVNSMSKSKANTTPIPVVKSSSCDNIIAQVGDHPKRGFPYAFLRSKLSVLPEENGGSVLNKKRLLENSLKLLNETSALAKSPPLTNPSNSLRGSIRNRNSLTESDFSDSCISPLSEPYSNQVEQIYSQISPTRLHTVPDENIAPTGYCNFSRTILNDWEPSYQRLSSCISSNESGYDSDGRQEHITACSPDSSKKHFPTVNQISSDIGTRLSTSSSICFNSVIDTGTIRRRFRQIKLEKKNITDRLGLIMQPYYFRLDNDLGVEVRYWISEIEVNGLAYR